MYLWVYSYYTRQLFHSFQWSKWLWGFLCATENKTSFITNFNEKKKKKPTKNHPQPGWYWDIPSLLFHLIQYTLFFLCLLYSWINSSWKRNISNTVISRTLECSVREINLSFIHFFCRVIYIELWLFIKTFFRYSMFCKYEVNKFTFVINTFF